MKLQDCIGVWFSRLKCDREERPFTYDFSMCGDHPKEATYRYYGDLADGTCCGASVFPSMISYADFRDPPFTGLVLVDENGKMKTLTPAERMHLQPAEHYFPIAVVPSPSGKSLAWMTEGELWTWRMDSREGRFIGDEGTAETRFGDRKVKDACMHADGILEVLLEDGETLGIFCDEEMFLQPYEGGWVPGDEAAAWNLAQNPHCWTDSMRLMIRGTDDSWDYYDCNVRRVCFEPGLEILKAGILGMNPLLDTVVIPESVRQVETFAFGCCENLKNLEIRGDLSRIAGWAGDAFEGCACEETYLQLRDREILKKKTAWLEEMKRCLAEQKARYPRMNEEDVVKFVFQGMLGVGHLVESDQAALAYLREEMDGLEPDPEEPLVEAISPNWLRVNLRAAKAGGETPEELASMLVRSSQMRPMSFTRQDVYDFCTELDGSEKMKEAAARVLEEKWLPRHSQAYREAYAPAYRVIYKDYR